MRSMLASMLFVSALPLGVLHAADFEIGDRDVAALVQALQESAQTPEADRIRLAWGGIYTLAEADSAGLGLPTLQGEIHIEGNGAEIRRYADAPMALLEVAEGARVFIDKLTLAEGNLGALRNRGELTLQRVAIIDSSHRDTGAIVFNTGHLILRDSLIGWNQLSAREGDSGLIENRGRLEMSGARIVGNSVSRASERMSGAAAVLNSGELSADATDFQANDLIDPYGGLSFHAVLNAGGGTAQGLLPTTLIAEVLDPR
jgi:hypothetical protein